MSDAHAGYYVTADRDFHVLLEAAAVDRAVRLSLAVGAAETGGVLIGRHEDNGAVAIVEEVTASPRGSIFGRFSFERAPGALRALLHRRWSSRRHYLGEWHFHPGQPPGPSGTDRATMKKIAESRRYACREPLLLIVGQAPSGAAVLSLHVFPKGQPTVQLMPAISGALGPDTESDS